MIESSHRTLCAPSPILCYPLCSPSQSHIRPHNSDNDDWLEKFGNDLSLFDFSITSRQFIDGSESTIERWRNVLNDARVHIGGKCGVGLAAHH